MRASETSSGQETPGDQALCSCRPGVVLKVVYLNLAILGQTPELHICSDFKAQPKNYRQIFHPSQACRVEVGGWTQLPGLRVWPGKASEWS